MPADSRPPIAVEFFGIPRARAGTATATVRGATLGDVLIALANQFPALAAACFDGRQLRHGYLANLSGRRFITDPSTPLSPGDSLLLLSADAGG